MMQRPPLPLAQDDDYGCSICTTANLLYVFHILDHPDVNWVNNRLNRQPGTEVWDESLTLLLLEQGLSAYNIEAFDSIAFNAQGIDYLRQHYSDLWDNEWENFYTPEMITDTQVRSLKLEAEIAKHTFPYYTEMRKPTMNDIIHFIQAGCVVDLALREGNKLFSHAAFVYDVYSESDESFARLYIPNEDESDTLCDLSFEELAEEWDGYWLDAWWP